MNLTIYQADAFTDKLFSGNPAAVVPLDKWLPDSLMQNIAMENNLAETAFFVPSQNGYDIRWFTPSSEINLCGHATLASAFILFNFLGNTQEQIIFNSKSGPLRVSQKEGLIIMDFPNWLPQPFEDFPKDLKEMLGVKDIVSVSKNRDLLVLLPSEEDVINARPDFNRISETGFNIIITAEGNDCDFVSRFFAPALGVNEDPVTGSSHSQLIPFWADKLSRQKMTAKQLSKRGGVLWVGVEGDRVTMAGKASFYMKGEIFL
jgi:PhzF family phenazine biosynthesis protein